MHCMSNIKRGLSILRGDGGQPNPSGASGGGSQIQMEGWIGEYCGYGSHIRIPLCYCFIGDNVQTKK